MLNNIFGGIKMMESNRVKREKVWHNKTFGTDVRAKVGKFYSINYLLNKEFDAIINENLKKKRPFLWIMGVVPVII
jgi:hypothetical protein